MVHFSTIQAVRGEGSPQDAYACSKAGVLALSRSLAIQYAEAGVRSNAVLPGPIETPMQSRMAENPEFKQAIEGFVPLKRMASADDLANVAMFLLSDLSITITGSEIVADGGIIARLG